MNSLLYPLDYLAFGDQSATQASNLENAVNLLQTQAADTAVQQNLTRVTLGQGVIANSKDLKAVARSALMPLTAVGSRNKIPSSATGNFAYMAGGRGHGTELFAGSAVFFFSNESAAPEGFTLSEQRTYAGTTFTLNAGYWFAGIAEKIVRAIDKISYLQATVRNIGQEIGIPRSGAAGLGDLIKGLVVGGCPIATPTISTNVGDSYTYATETNASIGAVLSTAVFSPHNGVTQGGNGWIFGGNAAGWSFANIIQTIQRVVVANNTCSIHGLGLGTGHLVHACAGGPDSAFIAGGQSAANAPLFSNQITRFTYSTGVSALLGATLSEAMVCSDGVSSSNAMYVLGGDTALSAWQGTKKIERVVFASGTATLLGATLPFGMADQGAVGDYSPSFS